MKARVSIHGRRRRARRTRVVFLVVWAQGVWISKKIILNLPAFIPTLYYQG